MKKYLALVLALCMVFALAACGQSAAPASAPAADNLVGVAMPTKDLQRWKQQGRQVTASVNLSRSDFLKNPDLPAHFHDLITRYGLSPDQLHLEITETAYVENPELLISTTQQFREYGFQVEMDDFGSGYSSLNVFSRFDVDLIKLDMALVQHLDDHNGINREIIKAMISIARALGIETLAEGIETEEQKEFLNSVGCDLGQGFLMRRPVPLETILFIVRSDSYVGRWESNAERQQFVESAARPPEPDDPA